MSRIRQAHLKHAGTKDEDSSMEADQKDRACSRAGEQLKLLWISGLRFRGLDHFRPLWRVAGTVEAPLPRNFSGMGNITYPLLPIRHRVRKLTLVSRLQLGHGALWIGDRACVLDSPYRHLG
jgi:hypothetical protein